MRRPVPDQATQCLEMTFELAEELLRYLKVRTRYSDVASMACLLASVTLHFRAIDDLRADEESSAKVAAAVRRAILAIDEEVADAH